MGGNRVETRPLIVGGGLAGCEAAWQLARAGIEVVLAEMRPTSTTPVHTTGDLAELVCSNSLRGDSPANAVGQLKRELGALDSLIISSARRTAVPAGGALAVDRAAFAALVTSRLNDHPRISIERREIVDLPLGPAIIASGPLTSERLHGSLAALLGEEALSFFDAIAPMVAVDSLDHDILYRASRYGKGDGADYLNCPLDRDQYEVFITNLLAGETTPFRRFEAEDIRYFEGCLPIEVMAERGRDTLRFGPMKPVGLEDPRTGARPWAVIQLRQDDLAAENWNMVGFQTKLKQGEQKRILQQLPGFANARFVRLGMIHRNTFINSPAHLDASLRLKAAPHIRLAGQVTGVEGYVESAATGLLAARFLLAELHGLEPAAPPPHTALGGLIRHVTRPAGRDFQPSNITWGLMVCPEELRRVRNKKERRQHQADQAQEAAEAWGNTKPGTG